MFSSWRQLVQVGPSWVKLERFSVRILYLEVRFENQLVTDDAAHITALDIAGAYGTGMGNMEGTCGALVGAGMIVGLATKDRIKSRARMKEMMEKFQARNGATQCRLLKGIGTGKPLRDCPDCVADASEFLEEYL